MFEGDYMKVGIVIVAWKIKIFKRVLDRWSFEYTQETCPGCITLMVTTEDVEALQSCVKEANNEAARSKMQ